MELKDFVSGTMKQIIDGVIEAQEYAKYKMCKLIYNKFYQLAHL